MTKTALGLALMGMFVIGYFSGARRNPERRTPLQSSKPLSEPQPAGSKGSSASLAVEQGAGEPSATPTVPMPLVLSDSPRSNAQFSKLMIACREVESSWRARFISPFVTARWETADRDYIAASASRAEKNFSRAIQKSASWRATTQFAVGSEFVDLMTTIRFHPPKPDDDEPQTCWTAETFYKKSSSSEADKEWSVLGVNGGCSTTDLDQRAEPVATHLSYDFDKLGSAVSAFIIPLDVLAHNPLRYLPTTEEGGWREANLNYYPISDVELNGGGRGPASVEK